MTTPNRENPVIPSGQDGKIMWKHVKIHDPWNSF